MTRNLKIKAIVFDLKVIIDGANADKVARGEAPQPREPVVPPAPLTKEAAQINAVPHNPPVPPPKLDVPLDPRAKYAAKLSMKLAKNLSNKVNQFGPTGLQATLLGTASRWLLAEGMGDVLDYSFKRTLRLAVIGSPVKYQLHTIEQLRNQMNQTKFAYIRPSIDPETFPGVVPQKYIDVHTRQSFIDLEDELKLSKNDILLVSGEESVLSMGRARGYYTVRFRPPGALHGQVITDYVATNAVEIKDSVDDLIGIALRNSVF